MARRSSDDETTGSRGADPRGTEPQSTDPQSVDDASYSPAFAEAMGRTIKVIRTDLGVDRRALADRAGISYSYLTEIENGNKPPSSSVLRQIAHALGLRMSQLTEAAELRHEARTAPQPEAPATLAPAAPFAAAPVQAEQLALGSRESSLSPRGLSRDWAMQPSLRGPDRNLRSAFLELEQLLRQMAPDDIERLLDYARRLVR